MDPQPGDVLVKKCVQRKVVAVREFVVVFETYRDGFTRFCHPWLAQWRRWAKGAEVVQ